MVGLMAWNGQVLVSINLQSKHHYLVLHYYGKQSKPHINMLHYSLDRYLPSYTCHNAIHEVQLEEQMQGIKSLFYKVTND